MPILKPAEGLSPTPSAERFRAAFTRSISGREFCMPTWTALVTLLAIMLYLYTGVRVASARAKYRVQAPATTGHPDFERVFRVQMNTLEWMPIFLPSLVVCNLC
jgi:uncharacterized membrane protein YecN with MAPEG domain